MLWSRAIIDAALRPRRGGPRFVDADEKARADELANDPRTNEQLIYDLMIDTLRAGALADAEQVFGARQAGVRVVVVADTHEGDVDEPETVRPVLPAIDDPVALAGLVALAEESGEPVPNWMTAQHLCDTSLTTCVVDNAGDPLYLGREARLFSARQKITLAIRDGGCRWRNMQLHHGGWRITRDGLGEFMLHPPGGGAVIPLPPRLQLRYAFGDLDPPPRRFRPAA